MKKGIIITLPRHDDLTEYLSQFSCYIIEEAAKNNINLKPLKDGAANKANFEKVAKKLDYNFIIFNGHGTDSQIKGYKDEVLVESGINEELLKGKIVYARSCHAALKLGKECISKGSNGCFIGYIAPFKVCANSECFSNLLNDRIASFFLEPSNQIPISLIKGNSATEANEKSKNAILKSINKVLRDPLEYSPLIAEDLWNNFENQVVLGNLNAKI